MKIELQNAWIRVMSAIQTSESMESYVLEPVVLAFSHRKEFISFLSNQADDERRHSLLLKNYLCEHFNYIKDKPTLSDRIFYSLLFPALQLIFRKNGLYGLCALLFYELFSVGLYRELKQCAHRQGLFELEELFAGILKDESRHIKGVTELIRAVVKDKIRVRRQFININSLLSLISFDVSFEKWAFYNREIRQSLLRLNVSPELINQRRKHALSRVKALLCERSVVKYAARSS